jgi:predicted O-methyltransferase YrrM
MPRFSIVIPTYLNAPGLETLLKSIAQYTDLSDVEIVISANGASAETKDLPAKLGISATILWFENPVGFSRAVNAGIKESHGDLIVLLNDDCVLLDQPKNRWLVLLSAPFSDPQVGITGSHKLWDPDTQHDFIIFFCAMLRRTMIEQLGGLDESLSPFYGEDITMCIEAERAGWKWVQVPVGEECRLVEVPDSEHLPEWKRQRWVGNFPISHDGETTLGQLPNHVEVVERNRAKLRAKYGPVNIARAEQIEGWMGHDELIWLATQARTRKVIVELGSHCGRSTRAFADNLPEGGRIYAVDTWEDLGILDRFEANLADHISAGSVIPLRADGAIAARSLRVKADLIFIDALHDEASIRADILNWQPVLAEGGLLCGHDYSDTFPDVIKVVDELLIARQPPNTGIWEALDRPNITESVEGYGGFFCTEKQTSSLSA